MTISLAFSAQRKIIRFLIEDRVVTYYDEVWKGGIRIMPSQTPEMRLMLRKMLMSRKATLQHMGALIVEANSGRGKEEYDKCTSEEGIAEIIRRDCLHKGLVEVKYDASLD